MSMNGGNDLVPGQNRGATRAATSGVAPSNVGYSGYSEYFHNKELQQLESDVQYRKRYQLEHSVPCPDLFKDCTIYVNGRTEPTRFQLHKLVILHGGRFKHYLSGKTAVTHIVATELNLSKRTALANYKVVRPEWITESIARGKLLPWQDFKIIQVSGLQSRITDFSTVRNCMDPNFISSFFKASRLHHLSNWKFQLRDAFVKEFMGSYSKTSPKQEYVYFHIDFDCFFAQVSAKIDGKYDINTTPIAISHGINNSDISSCNYVARSFGVHNGMWVSSALKLCPNLKILDYEFDEYEAISNLFYKALKGFNGFRMVLPFSIDEAICCMEFKPEISYDYLRQKCEQLRQDIYDTTQGYSVSIGCGPSVLLARLALQKGKPNGFHIAWFDAIEGTRSFLDEFTLKDLPGIGYSTEHKIREEFGNSIKVSDLRHLLEDSDFVQKFIRVVGTKTSKKIQTFLEGHDDDETAKLIKDPMSYFQKKSLSVEINYAIRFKNIDDVDTFLERLSQYLLEKMRDAGMMTRQITLKLMKRTEGSPIEPPKFMGMGKCDALSKASTLGISTNKFGTITSECKTLFRLLSVPPTEVRGIGIQFHKLTEVNQKSMYKDVTLNLSKKERTRAQDVSNVYKDDQPHTPQNTTYSSPIKSYWDRHSKRSATPFQYDFPDELDPGFMANLPKDVQEEVLSHHKMAKRAKRSLRNTIMENPKKQVPLTQDLHFIHDGKLVPPLSFQGLTSTKKICKTLVDWVDNTIVIGPHDKDMELFVGYLDKLAEQGRPHIILQYIKTIKNRIDDHYNTHTEGAEQWEFLMLRKLVPILNKTRGRVKYNLTFDL